MVNKILLFTVLVVSAVFLINIPGVCLAADNMGINKRDSSQGDINADQQRQTNRDRDNTGINKRDRSPEKMTAGQQSETKEDRMVTQKIRQAIVDDKSLSTYAHNVKIITVDGMITLRGPVRSEAEKRSIEEKAGQIAGKDKVRSEIQIAPKKQDN